MCNAMTLIFKCNNIQLVKKSAHKKTIHQMEVKLHNGNWCCGAAAVALI